MSDDILWDLLKMHDEDRKSLKSRMVKTCGDRMVEELNKAINKNLDAQLMSYNDARTERIDDQLEELRRQRDYYAAREVYLKEQSNAK